MDFKKISQLIIIKQTIFALPFAWTGIIFAGGAGIRQWILVSMALFFARTAGMAFNRVLDADIDAKNPRTRKRLVPSGRVKKGGVWLLAAGSSAGLITVSYLLNTLVFYLSFVAVLLLFTYSFFKRFSSGSHFYLGLVEACAPVGGYLAVTGSFSVITFLPGIAVMFWIAGLDILYALQDQKFDSNAGLHSVPVRFGKKGAIYISRAAYICAVMSLIAAGVMSGFEHAYWIGVGSAAIILTGQQLLIRKSGSAATIQKIFSINHYISFTIFLGCLMEYIIRSKSNFN